MRSTYAAAPGGRLRKTPSHREQALRRGLLVALAALAVALMSALASSLSATSGDPTGQTQTGPFSYFPS